MKKLFFISFITSVIGIVIGTNLFAAAPQSCVVDTTFNRVECCVHIAADGHCAVGEDVMLFNI